MLFPIKIFEIFIQSYLVVKLETALRVRRYAFSVKLKSPFTQSDSESIGCLIKALVVEHTFGCQRSV
jgi:hypothetical protein